jgi:hypothetical protein
MALDGVAIVPAAGPEPAPIAICAVAASELAPNTKPTAIARIRMTHLT